ncbi:MAG: lipid-A-disaccharide synthase N-terminal domain-containing protein [Flavobacteriaceae bacterium]|nr:lipid-A-disaccharide synthase N-terminal domain-containing protein [Flavobacteriaceae bacterium]
MSNWMVYGIGFMSQILFSSRLLVQWLQSEKAKKVVTPLLFWQLSLVASFLMFIYGYLRHDFAIVLGQVLTYFIYIRNLQIDGYWKKLPKLFSIFIFIFPVLVIIYSYNDNQISSEIFFKNENIPLWLLSLGIVAQIIFMLRFVVQWGYSEKQKTAYLPRGFWWFSIAGSLLIFIYAIFRKDPVLLIGNSFGSVVYVRNLILLKKTNNETK